MTPQDRTYQASDATALPMRVWSPQRPRAVLVYLHGIQSHSGWYEASSRHLAEAGVAVYQLERRGSGTDRTHERGHVDRAETWLEDVAAAARLACGETGLAPVHLCGVSWGGKLALACAAHRPDLYRSLILAAPGILPRVDPTLAVKVRVAQSLLTGRPLQRFPIPLQDPHLFTENPDRVRYIAGDPLSLREVTARFMYESRRLDALARDAARVVTRPTLLALACAAHRPDLYRSLILAAPGIVPRVDPALAVKVRVAQSLLAGQPLRRFPIPLQDPHLFTENPERVRYIAADPLGLHEVTARFMYESRRLDDLVRQAARVVTRPTLLALAEKDRIIDNAATWALVEAMPCSRRQVTVYPGASHTLEFEPAPAAYFRDLVTWIEGVEAS